MVGAFERVGFQRSCQSVANAAVAGGAVVDGGVFPEGAHLIDDGQAQASADAQCRQRRQHRRMSVQHIGANLPCHVEQALLDLTHECKFLDQWQRCSPA